MFCSDNLEESHYLDKKRRKGEKKEEKGGDKRIEEVDSIEDINIPKKQEVKTWTK